MITFILVITKYKKVQQLSLQTVFLKVKINLSTSLQAVAVQVTVHRPVSVCSMFLTNLKVAIEENITKQVQSHFILLGDFYAYNSMLCSSTINKIIIIK